MINHSARAVFGTLVLIFAFSACACLPDIVTAPFEAKDLKPAGLNSWGASAKRQLVLSFDETVSAQVADFDFSSAEGTAGSPAITVESIVANPVDAESTESTLVLSVSGDFQPGVFYAVSGMVHDGSGNATSFTLPFWGYNPEPPKLLLNELLTEGSEKHPDAIELFVRAGGNLAGVALYLGTQSDFDARFVFPACRVATGEYIVLHLKPEGLATELDECGAVDRSGGSDATPGARDFWYRDAAVASLPGKNGVVTLYKNPNGDSMDAVVYSERTSESDQKYGGFGTAKFRDRVAAVAAAGAWKLSGTTPKPEDAARSPGVTSTRTLCRSAGSADSDSSSDWHIVPSKGSSIGGANSDKVHAP